MFCLPDQQGRQAQGPRHHAAARHPRGVGARAAAVSRLAGARKRARRARSAARPSTSSTTAVMVPKRTGDRDRDSRSWWARWSPTRAAPWHATCPDPAREANHGRLPHPRHRARRPGRLSAAAVHLDSVNLPDDRGRAGADHRTLAAVVRGGGVGGERAGREGPLLRVRGRRARQRPGRRGRR